MPDEPIDAEIVPEPAPAPPAAPPAADYTDGGVPTLDYVRDKIEGRYATALGMEELVGETEQARSLDEQEAARKKAAAEKLAEIRRSIGG
jgi:phage shock protein A